MLHEWFSSLAGENKHLVTSCVTGDGLTACGTALL